MPKLESRELEQVLDIILTQLQEKGILPTTISASEKNNIVHNVIETLSNYEELSLDDIKKPQVKNSLCISLVSEYVGIKNPNHKFDYGMLFDQDLSLKKDIQSKLQIGIKNLLTELNNTAPTPEGKLQPEIIDKMAINMANDLTNKYMSQENNNKLYENKSLFQTLGEIFTGILYGSENSPLTESLRNLHGGIDPRIAGGVVSPVRYAAGNFGGVVDYIATPNDESFLGKASGFNPGAFDHLGIENAIQNRITSMSAVPTNKSTSLLDDVLDGVYEQIAAKEATTTYTTPRPPTGM